MKVGFVSSFLFFLCLTTWADGVSDLYNNQTYSVKKFTTDNGLCHNNIFWISRDKTGFLWIATWDGISRFDGNEFRNYYHQPGEVNTIPFFAVDKITVDSLNNVWVGPQVRYDRANDRFIRENLVSVSNSKNCDIEVGTDGELWILVEDGFFRYDLQTGHSSKYRFIFRNKQEMENFYIYSYQTFTDNIGGLWLAGRHNFPTEYLIYKAELSDDSCITMVNCGILPKSLINDSQNSNEILYLTVSISPTEETWLFSKFGLYLLDSTLQKFKLYNGPLNPADFSGKPFYTWVDSKSGLNIIDCARQKLIHIVSDQGNNIAATWLDADGTIWYGDKNDSPGNSGLNRCTPIPDYFSHFLTEKDESGNNRLVFPVCQGPDGEIWAGTRYSDNLFRILKNGRVVEQSFYDKKIGADHLRIRSMFSDSTGVWMGCTQSYLVRYDFASQKFTSYKVSAKDKDGGDIDLGLHNILPVDNDLLINGGEGVYRFYPQSGKIELKYFYEVRGSMYCFIKDGEKGYWLGHHTNTIVHLDENLKETGRYQLGNEFNNVEHILTGDSSDVWVALMGGGLAHFYPETQKVKFYTTADGLTNNTVYSILKDKKGNLWISTNNGISRFNPQSGNFRNFRMDNGLLIREFNSDSWFQSSDGRIFFGGVGGLVGFHPDSINDANEEINQNPLLITEFSVSGVPRLFNKAVCDMDTVTLNKGDNNFQIKFACLDFNNPEKVRYRYRLSVVNNQWTETGYRNRMVNYAGLSPGKYHFRLEATNYNGKWISSKTLCIVIPYFLYETWWFRLLILMLAILIISMVLLLYIRQIRLKAMQKEGELRLESLRGQMNPHFIFNSLNSINYFISRNEKLLANLYIADFSRLIRAILQNLSSEYIPLDKEIESLQDYLKLEHLRFGDKFNYTLDADGISNWKQILVFPGMVQPFIENSVWHGVRGLDERLGIISIRFLPGDNESVRCIVEDDGIGRKQSELFKSWFPGKKSRGIGIVLERMKVINSLRKTSFKVTIEDAFPDREETGTRVMIDIPAKVNE